MPSASTGRRRLVALSVATAAVAVLALAAASLSSADTARTNAAPNLAKLKARIDAATALPKFIAPGPAFDTSKVKGKTIFSIPVSTANPFTANIETAMAGAAKVLGIKFIEFPNQAQPSQWVQGINQAINQKVNLIDLLGGVDPAVLAPQLKQVRAAKIPVGTSHLYDVTQKPPASIDFSIPADYQHAARLEADWTILDTKGHADVVVITSNEIVPTAPIVAALKDEFAKECGSACKLTFINTPVPDWATKITPNVQSALVNDPKINYVIPIYDSMSQFVVPAITAAGKKGKVSIATFNGTPFVMGYLAQKNVVKFEVGENLNWLGWAYIDAEARILAGLKLPKTFNEHTAERAFTAANIKDAGNPPQLSTGYGNAYVQGYKKLWGVK